MNVRLFENRVPSKIIVHQYVFIWNGHLGLYNMFKLQAHPNVMLSCIRGFIHVYIYIYLYIHDYISLYTHMCTYIYIYTYIDIYMYIFIIPCMIISHQYSFFWPLGWLQLGGLDPYPRETIRLFKVPSQTSTGDGRIWRVSGRATPFIKPVRVFHGRNPGIPRMMVIHDVIPCEYWYMSHKPRYPKGILSWSACL